VKNYTIKGDTPVRALINLLQADPLMAIFKPEVITLADNKAVVRCADCPTQTARIRDGKGVFPGQPVCLAMYKAYAEVIDPQIKVSCSACPSDIHPPQHWCEWQFEI
jgi:hypothetical protein